MEIKYGFHRRLDEVLLRKVGVRSALALALGRNALNHSAENELM
jgi:hypothetical protein